MRETFPSEVDLGTRLKRARMRAWRRGMREMDLILGGYIDAHGVALDHDGLDTFELLLARRDQDLYDWVSGRRPDGPENATGGEAALLAEIAENWRVFSDPVSGQGG